MQNFDRNNIEHGAEVVDLPLEMTYGRDFMKLPYHVGRVITNTDPFNGVSPVTVSANGSNASVLFNIPTNARSGGHIIYKFDASCTGGVNPSFPYNMYTIIQRITIKIANVIVYDSNFSNLLANVYNMTDDCQSWQRHAGFQMCGMVPFRNDTVINGVTVAGRKTRASGHTYTLPLDISILNKCLPTVSKLMPNATFTIQMFFEPAINVIETDSGTNVSYTISNQKIVVESLSEPEGIINNIYNELQSDGYISIPYQFVKSEQFNIQPNTTTQTFTIPDKSQSIKSLVAVCQNFGPTGSIKADPTYWNKWNSFSTAGINNYTFKVNGIPFPSEPIDSTDNGGLAFKEYLCTFGNYESGSSFASGSFNYGYNVIGATGTVAPRFGNLWSLADNLVANSEADTPKRLYCMLFDLPLLYKDISPEPYRQCMGNGINTANNAAGLSMTISKTSDSNQYLVTVYTFSDAYLSISKTGQVVVVN